MKKDISEKCGQKVINLKRSEMAMSRVSEEFLSACLDGEERLVARRQYHIESFCIFVVISQEHFQFFT